MVVQHPGRIVMIGLNSAFRFQFDDLTFHLTQGCQKRCQNVRASQANKKPLVANYVATRGFEVERKGVEPSTSALRTQLQK